MLLSVPRFLKLFRLQPYQIIRKLSHIGPSGKDIPLEGIRTSRSDTFLKKPNLPWGFAIYRCSFKNDTAWRRMIQLIQEEVQDSIKLHLPPGKERTELMESHDLVIHDHLEKLDGASSHEVRDHFNEWVATQLPHVVSTPETLQMLKAGSDKPIPGPEHALGGAV